MVTSEIFVDARDGDDATGDGSRNAPFATVQRAMDSIGGAGAVVNVAPGEYSLKKPPKG